MDKELKIQFTSLSLSNFLQTSMLSFIIISIGTLFLILSSKTFLGNFIISIGLIYFVFGFFIMFLPEICLKLRKRREERKKEIIKEIKKGVKD